jgi:hypothetical protein
MSAEDLKLARTLIADPSWTRDAIASKIGVSHMTILPGVEACGDHQAPNASGRATAYSIVISSTTGGQAFTSRSQKMLITEEMTQ